MHRIFLILIVILLNTAMPFLLHECSAGPIKAHSAILLDCTTGKILFEQRAMSRIPPASLTKVLAMYTAFRIMDRRGIAFNALVTISEKAATIGGSSLGLRKGDKVTLDKLFYGMAVASGNDASVAVAEKLAGNTDNFTREMNLIARSLGMKSSKFINVNGLPAVGQYTTARDMLTLGRSYFYAFPRALRFHQAPSVTHRGKTEHNHNPLLSCYPGTLGLKTGWIIEAGYNIIAIARQSGHTLIAVVLGAKNSTIRLNETARLLNAAFASIRNKKSSTIAFLGISSSQAKKLKNSYSSPHSPLKSKKKGVNTGLAKAKKKK